MKRLNIKCAMFSLLMAISINEVKAAEFCVTTANELSSALLTADSNNQADIIRVAQGTYTRTFAGPFGSFVYFGSGETHSLQIIGGWTPFFDNPCGQLLGNTEYQTTLDADDEGRVLYLHTAGDVTIRNLNFTNAYIDINDHPNQNGGGLRVILEEPVGVIGNAVTEVTVENSSFLGNHAFGAGAVLVTGEGRFVFRNNIVLVNEHDSGANVVNLQASENYATNNTIYANTGGLYTHAGGSTQSLIANNLLWNNDDGDLNITGNASQVYVYNNNIGVQDGITPGTQLNNISVTPVFESGLLNFTPAWGSAMVDAGRVLPQFLPFPTPFHLNWSYGTQDFEGNPRVMNARVDIGAIEAPMPPDLIFADGFE